MQVDTRLGNHCYIRPQSVCKMGNHGEINIKRIFKEIINTGAAKVMQLSIPKNNEGWVKQHRRLYVGLPSAMQQVSCQSLSHSFIQGVPIYTG